MTKPATYARDGRIGRIVLDDGKANVINEAMLDAIDAALDQAERDQAVTVLSGRPGVFSAGFDLKVLAGDDAGSIHRMMDKGARLALRLLTFPLPVISACTGHCMPMGVFLMLASDVRIGARGDFLIGLNEVAIGLTLPAFAVELARGRMTPPGFNRALVCGERVNPDEAVTLGYLDALSPPDTFEETVAARAGALAALDMTAHAETKAKVRAPIAERMNAAIEAEITLEKAEAQVRKMREKGF